MSLTRTVTLKNLDMDLMAEAAEACGMTTDRNRKHRLYGGRTGAVAADLVVTPKDGSMEIGFIKNKEDYEISYDHMIGDHYGNLMSTYFEKMVEKRSRGRYRLVSKNNTGGKITLTLRRA